jgi:hypothetical protein
LRHCEPLACVVRAHSFPERFCSQPAANDMQLVAGTDRSVANAIDDR